MQAGVVIREAHASAQAFLEEMLYLSLYVPSGHEPFPRSILEQPDIAKYVEGWGKDGDIAFIALEDSVKVGAVWLRLLKGEQEGYGYVDDETPEIGIALLPEVRGQGVGQALLLKLLDKATITYDGVSLAVAKGNPAEGLYRRLGFVQVGEDEDSRVMLKYLRDA